MFQNPTYNIFHAVRVQLLWRCCRCRSDLDIMICVASITWAKIIPSKSALTQTRELFSPSWDSSALCIFSGEQSFFSQCTEVAVSHGFWQALQQPLQAWKKVLLSWNSSTREKFHLQYWAVGGGGCQTDSVYCYTVCVHVHCTLAKCTVYC